MNKTVLASALLVALASGTAAASTTVYEKDGQSVEIKGRMVGMYYSSDDKDEKGDQSYFRFGAKGKADINNDLYGVGVYETEVNASSKKDGLQTRLSYAGLGGNFGEATYGRQYGAYTLISDYTDTLEEFGADASGTGTDRFGTGKASSVLKYTGEFSGLAVEASYQLDNNEVTQPDGDTATSYGIAASYSLPMGFKVGAGYNQGEGVDGSDDAKVAAVSAAYDANNIYAAFLYSTGENWEDKKGTESDTDYDGYEVVLGYDFGNGFSAQAVYNFLEADAGSSVDVEDYYVVGAYYKFNKQLRTYAEYKADQIDGNEDILALAIRYDF
ncbi:porin [Photobacterium sp. CCB-ST2H9]|uniref:porin n=1 Tax=unclassified Photobacterium TaxID=2628852 RepID=UPI0020062308|nr:porin [Photobacterium sp. CCB-ST2H9]UTM56242.1 porin [Photobacterium sp. CCB-ST2H9]